MTGGVAGGGTGEGPNGGPSGGALRRLAVAAFVSPMGDALATTALILHLQRTVGTGTAVGTLLVAEALPPLLSPITGAIADRAHDRRRLIVIATLAQAAVVALMAALLPPLAPLAGLVFVRAALDAVVAPALGAAVPELVDDDTKLAAANGLLGGARELGNVVGPPLAGILVAAANTRTALALDAVTFIAVIPLLPRLTSRTESPHTLRADALAGLAHVWRTPTTRIVAIGFWIAVLAMGPDDLVLPFLAADELHAGPRGIGVLLAAASMGLLLGLPLVARSSKRRTTTMLVGGLLVTATGNALTAVAPALAAAIVFQLVRGIGIPFVDVSVRTQLQRETPPHLRARALANVYGGVSVAAAAGYAIGGPFLDATSPRTAMAAVGLGGYLATAITAIALTATRAARHGRHDRADT